MTVAHRERTAEDAGPRAAGSRAAGASPPAARLRRPGLRDPRLLLGLVLVALAVALGSWAVGTAGATVPVLVAREDLAPGHALEGHVVVEEARMPPGATYLGPDDDLAGLVLTRTVGQGEAVPRAAAAPEADLGLRPVAVTPARALPAGLGTGATVDLWYVPDAGEESGPPRPLVAGVTVAEVTDGGGTFAVGGGATVHVLVPVDDLAGVLESLAADGTVEVVPVPGAAAGP